MAKLKEAQLQGEMSSGIGAITLRCPNCRTDARIPFAVLPALADLIRKYWSPVERELPALGKYDLSRVVLVLLAVGDISPRARGPLQMDQDDNYRRIKPARYDSFTKKWHDPINRSLVYQNVTHWMTLPEPPAAIDRRHEECEI